jgi:hypothetical protein
MRCDDDSKYGVQNEGDSGSRLRGHASGIDDGDEFDRNYVSGGRGAGGGAIGPDVELLFLLIIEPFAYCKYQSHHHRTIHIHQYIGTLESTWSIQFLKHVLNEELLASFASSAALVPTFVEIVPCRSELVRSRVADAEDPGEPAVLAPRVHDGILSTLVGRVGQHAAACNHTKRRCSRSRITCNSMRRLKSVLRLP